MKTRISSGRRGQLSLVARPTFETRTCKLETCSKGPGGTRGTFIVQLGLRGRPSDYCTPACARRARRARTLSKPANKANQRRYHANCVARQSAWYENLVPNDRAKLEAVARETRTRLRDLRHDLDKFTFNTVTGKWEKGT